MSVPLARGAAGTFRHWEPKNGILMNVSRSTDVALVQVTLLRDACSSGTGMPGPSLLVMKSGTMKMVEPAEDAGLTTPAVRTAAPARTFDAGEAFVHPADAHKFVNHTDTDAVFYIAYFVPAGVSPAPTTVPIPIGPDC